MLKIRRLDRNMCYNDFYETMQCACGDVFTASCDIEPTGCAFAWFLLLLSVVAHALHYCGGDKGESDDGEPNTMYS